MKNSKKALILILVLLVTLTLSACGSDKLDKHTKLNKADLKVLKKNYEDLTEDEHARYRTLEEKMSANEMENLRDDLKRLYIGEQKKYGASDEMAQEEFERWYDGRIRELRGELTPEEQASKDELAAAVKEEVDKSKGDIQSYVKAEKEIQDKLNKYAEENIDKIKEIKSEASPKGFRTKLVVKSLKDITVGEINNFRIAIADVVMETVEIEEVEVKLYMGSEEKDTYTFKFGSGWDKEVNL